MQLAITFGDLSDGFSASTIITETLLLLVERVPNFSATIRTVNISVVTWNITMAELGNGLTINNFPLVLQVRWWYEHSMAETVSADSSSPQPVMTIKV